MHEFQRQPDRPRPAPSHGLPTAWAIVLAVAFVAFAVAVSLGYVPIDMGMRHPFTATATPLIRQR